VISLCTTQLDAMCAPNVGFCGFDLEIAGDPNAYRWEPGHRFYIRPLAAGDTRVLEDVTLDYIGVDPRRTVKLRCLAARADARTGANLRPRVIAVRRGAAQAVDAARPVAARDRRDRARRVGAAYLAFFAISRCAAASAVYSFASAP
jgi:hypothetical protein